MRDLGNTDNKATIKDNISGSEIELSYRIPTPSELQQFYSSSIKRRGGKTISNAVEARLRFALNIITGFRDGDFGKDGKPISSNPESDNYYSGWKKLLEEKAADILDAFVFTTFEAARYQTAGVETEDSEELPLAKN